MISENILRTRLAEIGRIKIGGLDETVRKTQSGKEWQMPVKYDHFVVTGMERDEKGNFRRDDSIHALIGPEPKELRIRLLYNDPDLSFRTQLALYSGKTCCCRGDGITAEKLDRKTGELVQVQCPCSELEKESNGCKPHGVLTCLLEQAQLCGGVYRFTTTAWNSIRSISSSLNFIVACTGGKIAGLPLMLKYFKKTTIRKDGTPTTIPVVTIVYEGSPVQLLEQAVDTEKKRLSAGIRMELLENQVRQEIANPVIIEDEEDIPEFHPEEPPPAATLTVDAGGSDGDTVNIAPTPPARKEDSPKKSQMHFFKCEACGHVHTTDCPGALAVCVKCNYKGIQKQFPDLESAKKYVYPVKSGKSEVGVAETKPLAKPAVLEDKALTLEQIAEEIARLRGEKCLMQADFVKMAKEACGKAVLDPAKMTLEQANKLLGLVREFGGGK